MKILHYSLGFPPYRTGGLTKFCMDLMYQQSGESHKVALLWPGEMRLINHSTKIKYCGRISEIESFEIKNPLPIPYDEGIVKLDYFMQDSDTNVYKKMLNEWKPDVIHIHTLMGLHKEFIVAAKSCNIRLVYTAHDFFPICPKITMFRHNQVCASINSCYECPECNMTALAMWKGWVLQHPLYRKTKDLNVVKKLRKEHRDNYLGGKTFVNSENNGSPQNEPDDYKKLREYYRKLLELMDCVHFNSNITRQIYKMYLGEFPAQTVAITHLNIKDNRRDKIFGNRLRLTYLGPQGEAKGFFLLKAALNKLWNERNDFELNVFFKPTEMSPYIKSNKRYSYDDLAGVFENTDVLIAPSILYETFGFTVLEAMSFGVPVIVSGNVGARDIIPDGAGEIIEDISVDKLYSVISSLTPKKLRQMNRVICEKFEVPTMEMMSKQICKLCYEREN